MQNHNEILYRAFKWPFKYIAHWRWSCCWNLTAFSVHNDVVQCSAWCYVFCGFHALSRCNGPVKINVNKPWIFNIILCNGFKQQMVHYGSMHEQCLTLSERVLFLNDVLFEWFNIFYCSNEMMVHSCQCLTQMFVHISTDARYLKYGHILFIPFTLYKN